MSNSLGRTFPWNKPFKICPEINILKCVCMRPSFKSLLSICTTTIVFFVFQHWSLQSISIQQPELYF
jgi:hypothetical protein